MKMKYWLLSLVVAALAACADVAPRSSTAGSGAGLPPPVDFDDSREATRPSQRISSGGSGGGATSAFTSGASGAAEDAALDESCVEERDADGHVVVTCSYGDVTCVETYDDAGDLLSWDCGDHGSYICDYSGDNIVCKYDDGSGSLCTEVFDREWNMISSDCGIEYTPPTEECLVNDDGTVLCTYDEGGYMHCTYLFDADGIILEVHCTGAAAIDCTTDEISNQLACHIQIMSDPPCDMVMARNDDYGILSSDCDIDMDGVQDCSATSSGGQECWIDGCQYIFDADGNQISSTCDDPLPSECMADAECEAFHGAGAVCVAGVCEVPDGPTPVPPPDGTTCMDPDDPTVHYVADAETCTRITFVCEAGQEAFWDACGCGCVDLLGGGVR